MNHRSLASVALLIKTLYQNSPVKNQPKLITAYSKMGSEQSSCATNDTTISREGKSLPISARGRKSIPNSKIEVTAVETPIEVSIQDMDMGRMPELDATSFAAEHYISTDDESSYSDSSDDESDDEECKFLWIFPCLRFWRKIHVSHTFSDSFLMALTRHSG